MEANASTGDVVECEDCGLDLEIVGLDPLEFEVEDDFMSEDIDEDDEEY